VNVARTERSAIREHNTPQQNVIHIHDTPVFIAPSFPGFHFIPSGLPLLVIVHAAILPRRACGSHPILAAVGRPTITSGGPPLKARSDTGGDIIYTSPRRWISAVRAFIDFVVERLAAICLTGAKNT